MTAHVLKVQDVLDTLETINSSVAQGYISAGFGIASLYDLKNQLTDINPQTGGQLDDLIIVVAQAEFNMLDGMDQGVHTSH